MAASSVKGSTIVTTLDLLRERHGEAAVDAIRKTLPDGARAALPADLRPLPTDTVAFEVWAEFMLAVDALYGRPHSIVRELGREGYVRLLRTTYRNWIRAGSPMESLRRLPLLWDQVTRDLGRLDVEGHGHRALVRGYFDVPLRFRTLVANRVAGTIEAVIIVAGGEGYVHIQDHADRVDFLVRLVIPSIPPPA